MESNPSNWVNLQDLLDLNPGERERLQKGAQDYASGAAKQNASLYGSLNSQIERDGGRGVGLGSYGDYQQIQRNNQEVARRAAMFGADPSSVQTGLGLAFGSGANAIDSAIFGGGGASGMQAWLKQYRDSQRGWDESAIQQQQHFQRVQQQNARNQAGFDANRARLNSWRSPDSGLNDSEWDALLNPQNHSQEEVDRARELQARNAARQRQQNYNRDPHYRSEIKPYGS